MDVLSKQKELKIGTIFNFALYKIGSSKNNVSGHEIVYQIYSIFTTTSKQ